MINLNEKSISDAVLKQQADCETPRLKTVMRSWLISCTIFLVRCA